MTWTSNVHPELVARVEALLDDPVLEDRFGVVSAARTVASQRVLYNRWLAGTGNLAANPDRVIRTGPDWPYKWVPRGSWHMVQADGHAHAVDLRRPSDVSRAEARALVHPLLPKYGLAATVASEWWHLQALTSNGWIDLPDTLIDKDDDMTLLYDPESGRLFLEFTRTGSTVLREYGTVTDARVAAATEVPGLAVVAEEQNLIL